jgi:hypothetical protein
MIFVVCLQCTVMKLKWGVFEIKAGFKDLIRCHTSRIIENIVDGMLQSVTGVESPVTDE